MLSLKNHQTLWPHSREQVQARKTSCESSYTRYVCCNCLITSCNLCWLIRSFLLLLQNEKKLLPSSFDELTDCTNIQHKYWCFMAGWKLINTKADKEVFCDWYHIDLIRIRTSSHSKQRWTQAAAAIERRGEVQWTLHQWMKTKTTRVEKNVCAMNVWCGEVFSVLTDSLGGSSDTSKYGLMLGPN